MSDPSSDEVIAEFIHEVLGLARNGRVQVSYQYRKTPGRWARAPPWKYAEGTVCSEDQQEHEETLCVAFPAKEHGKVDLIQFPSAGFQYSALEIRQETSPDPQPVRQRDQSRNASESVVVVQQQKPTAELPVVDQVQVLAAELASLKEMIANKAEEQPQKHVEQQLSSTTISTWADYIDGGGSPSLLSFLSTSFAVPASNWRQSKFADLSEWINIVANAPGWQLNKRLLEMGEQRLWSLRAVVEAEQKALAGRKVVFDAIMHAFKRDVIGKDDPFVQATKAIPNPRTTPHRQTLQRNAPIAGKLGTLRQTATFFTQKNVQKTSARGIRND